MADFCIHPTEGMIQSAHLPFQKKQADWKFWDTLTAAERGPDISALESEEAIVVANKDSNELCVVERNKESGHLGKVCSRQNVPAPACVVLKGWNGQ